MMKNIFKFFAVGIAISFAGCNDAIDIQQVGRLGAEQAFATVADLELGLLNVYNDFDNTPAIQFNAVFTDEIRIGFDNGGQGLGNGEYGFQLNPSSGITQALWNNYYTALNSANRVIAAAATITPETGEEDQYDDILGQTYALRAWAHFELMTYYTPDYEDGSSPGVILIDFVPGVSDVLGRNPASEVYASVESDLTAAAGLLEDAANPTFVSQEFVTALRARMAAYRGDYTTADGLAASLIAAHPLADQTQYTNMYLDTDNTEIIFKLERSPGDSYDGQGSTGSGFAGGWAGANFAFVNADLDGSPYFEMSTDLNNLLLAGDVRRTVNISPTATTVVPIYKYPGSQGQPLMNDLKIFRSSEMVLIRAEAAADAGDFAGAAGFIDQIRDARFGSDQAAPSYSTEAEAFTGILNERRIEMAYEGHRWVDLKRLGSRANQGINRDAGDCAVNGACTLATSDFRFTLPIPLLELDANDVIQQNDGY